jgi:hypothetical protein
VSTCSVASLESDEPLAATAARARTWLLLEQPGPWGAKALKDSHLDPQLGRALSRAGDEHGVRTALIRRPGRHADRDGEQPRRAFVAHTLPGRSWVSTALLDEPEELTALDLAALGAGESGGLPSGWCAHDGDPLVLVCTNGRRDRCCALQGRPLAAELAASGSGDTWEITHLGGHRFAPTLLVLPHGYAYGRIGAPAVKAVLEAAREGRVLTEHCRGRSAWDRPGQAADLAVRAHTGEQRADAVHVEAEEPAGTGRWVVSVRHADGRRWRVAVTTETGPPSAASCGAEPKPVRFLRVTGIEAADDC